MRIKEKIWAIKHQLRFIITWWLYVRETNRLEREIRSNRFTGFDTELQVSYMRAQLIKRYFSWVEEIDYESQG